MLGASGQATDGNRIIGSGGTSGATLTASYESSGVTVSSAIDVGSFDEFTLFVDYRAGAAETGNVCEVEVSFSPDATSWAVFDAWVNTSGQNAREIQYYNVPQRADALDCTIISINNIQCKFMRVRLKEEGVSSNAGKATVYLFPKGNV